MKGGACKQALASRRWLASRCVPGLPRMPLRPACVAAVLTGREYRRSGVERVRQAASNPP